MRPERRLGIPDAWLRLRCSRGWPQATLWVFDLRTSRHLEKLSVLGVGTQPICHVPAPLGLHFCLLWRQLLLLRHLTEEEIRLQRGK